MLELLDKDYVEGARKLENLCNLEKDTIKDQGIQESLGRAGFLGEPVDVAPEMQLGVALYRRVTAVYNVKQAHETYSKEFLTIGFRRLIQPHPMMLLVQFLLQLAFFIYSCYQVNSEHFDGSLKNYANFSLRLASGGWVSLCISTFTARSYNFSWKKYFKNMGDAELMQKFSCDTWEHVKVGEFSTGVVSSSNPKFMSAAEAATDCSLVENGDLSRFEKIMIALSLPIAVAMCALFGQVVPWICAYIWLALLFLGIPFAFYRQWRKLQNPNLVAEFFLLRVVSSTLVTIALQMSVVHAYYLYSGSGYMTALEKEFFNRGTTCFFLRLQNSTHDKVMLASQIF